MILLPTLLYYFLNGKFNHRESYWDIRQDFINSEMDMALGHDIKLTEKEQAVNKIFIHHKLEEYYRGMDFPNTFLPAKHFSEAKEGIKESQVFKFIKKIPKGAQLHIHEFGMASHKFIYNLTYMENLYICRENGDNRFVFSSQPDKTCKWKLLQTLRPDPALEKEIKASLQMPYPSDTFKNTDFVWKEAVAAMDRIKQIITYRPAFDKYINFALDEAYADKIMHVEFRSSLSPLYDMEGNEWDSYEVLEILIKIIEKFEQTHPNFLRGRLIFSVPKYSDNSTIDAFLKIASTIKESHSNFVAGIDLIGEEDAGRPLFDFVDKLKGVDIPTYLHAGETNWYGTYSDENLIDAVLLHTKRIGHGFALVKHPKIMELVKKTSTPIEITPISNQMFKHVSDLRNHPGAILLANDYPVVICSDYPGLWDAPGLSYEWYYTIMALASSCADLKMLKKLAMNSIEYSAFDDELKRQAYDIWNSQWNAFIDETLANLY